MKIKLKLLTIVVLIAITSTGYHASSASVRRYDVPDVRIVIHDRTIENRDMSYPILKIDGKNYIPLSWNFARMLGFNTHFSVERVLYLTRRAELEVKAFEIPAESNAIRGYLPTAVTYPIMIDNQVLKSNAPIYNIAGITYLSLPDTPALRLTEHFSLEVGLVLAETQALPTLPVKYNTLDLLDASKLIRNQGTEATCWAFAANTMFEIAVAIKTGVYHDFSETHLIEHAPVPSTTESGGNFSISSMYYLNRSGPVSNNGERLYALRDYRLFSGQMDQTKAAIRANGSVLSSIYLDEKNLSVYNASNAAYYNPSKSNPRTHELVLVGWDDQYDRNKFATSPKNDGAFIALNSFGNSWGDGGLMYISYEDVHVLGEVYAITDFEKYALSTMSYFHDKTGLTHFESFNDKHTAFGINNFTATRDETLKSISFFASPDVSEVKLMAGTNHYAGSNGTFFHTIKIDGAGYYTVDLPLKMRFKRGEAFWIGAEFKGRSAFIIPIEAPYPGILAPVYAGSNEGFIGSGRAYSDLTQIRKNASVAIRAITGIE